MNKDYFEDIFKDFFNETASNTNELEKIKENKENKEEKIDISSLNINEESKQMLLKIQNYMSEYNEDKKYIPFNLCINFKNERTINKICNLLNTNYLSGKGIKKISLYEKDKLEDVYNNSSIVVIKDISSINYESINDKQKLTYVLDELIKRSDKLITVLVGSEDEINTLFSINPSLKGKFLYSIKEEKPDIQIIYKDILKKINKKSDIKLLDYISETYPKISEDYDEYKDNLINYISLNKEVPNLEKTKSMDEIFKELNALVGLESIKSTLKDLADLISLKKKSKEINISDVNMHMIFLGNPGTGKTTVARLVGDILYNLGYIKENKLIEVTSKDLVGEYVGHTAPKTQSVIDKAMNGILFIDEAYTLSTGETNSYNQEAIMTLMEAMENKRGEIVLIFAGYTKEMKEFLASNSGISSRIGYTLDFPDYKEDKLIKIFNNFMTKAGFIVSKDAELKLKELIRKYKNNPNFGNARFVRNVYEKSIIKHASNTKDEKDLNIIKTITKEDISDEGLIK